MRTDTIYQLMEEVRRNDPTNFRDSFMRKVLGLTVLTDYNNQTYRIDDVCFDMTPKSTFKRKCQDVSFFQYYAEVILYE